MRVVSKRRNATEYQIVLQSFDSRQTASPALKLKASMRILMLALTVSNLVEKSMSSSENAHFLYSAHDLFL